MERQIENYLIRHVSDLPEPSPYTLKSDRAALLSGEYERKTHRFGKSRKHLQISSDGIYLCTQKTGKNRQRLIPVNDQHFRRSGESTATVSIIKTVEGDIIYSEQSDNFEKSPDGE